MPAIQIHHRGLSSREIEQINYGFDKLSIEAGIELEGTEPFSLVAMDDNRLVGCAIGVAHKNGEQYSGWFHLTDLFVVKEFRDQGVGSDLLIQLEEKLRSIGIQNVWLWTSGAATLRFYARHGYIKFAEMEHWYSDESSRVGLRKSLTPKALD